MSFDEEMKKIVPKFALDHYEHTSMQYTEIFHGCKNDNFQTKIITRQKNDIFLIIAQNLDPGYTLKPPQ